MTTVAPHLGDRAAFAEQAERYRHELLAEVGAVLDERESYSPSSNPVSVPLLCGGDVATARREYAHHPWPRAITRSVAGFMP
jgi:hypothetical protein